MTKPFIKTTYSLKVMINAVLLNSNRFKYINVQKLQVQNDNIYKVLSIIVLINKKNIQFEILNNSFNRYIFLRF